MLVPFGMVTTVDDEFNSVKVAMWLSLTVINACGARTLCIFMTAGDGENRADIVGCPTSLSYYQKFNG